MLPNFIIAGAQKAGTTSIFSVLLSHSKIFVPSIKEVHFFDNEKNYLKGLNYYKTFFKEYSNEKVIIDITPNYMYVKEVPKRIYNILPNVKLIFVLRDPIMRAYSNYWQNVRAMKEKRSFSDAIKVNGNPYVYKSMYYKHLENYLKTFDRENIFILISEELFETPINFYMKLFKILNVEFYEDLNYDKRENFARLPRIKIIEKFISSQNIIIRKLRSALPKNIKHKIKKIDEKYNMKKVKLPEIESETIEYLKKVFRDDVLMLKKTFGLNLSGWNEYC